MARQSAALGSGGYTTLRSQEAIASQRLRRIGLYALVCVFALIFAFPLYWAIASSLKREAEL